MVGVLPLWQLEHFTGEKLEHVITLFFCLDYGRYLESFQMRHLNGVITPLPWIGVVPQSLPGGFPDATYVTYFRPVRVDGAAHSPVRAPLFALSFAASAS